MSAMRTFPVIVGGIFQKRSSCIWKILWPASVGSTKDSMPIGKIWSLISGAARWLFRSDNQHTPDTEYQLSSLLR